MTIATQRNVLVVLAHQDDEIALAARILQEVRGGAAVHVAFLVDGSGGRDAESLAALTHLGVAERAIHFVGSEHGFRDGHLVEHLHEALATLSAAIEGTTFDAVYALAWQGGHHDHDASHLVALAFAKEHDLLDATWCAPLYDGFRRPGPFFRVMAPLPGGTWQHRSIDRRDARRILSLTSVYVSQKRTWRALIAGAAIQMLVRARESLQRADVALVRSSPHRGRLYYERRFRMPRARFEELAAPFIAQFL